MDQYDYIPDDMPLPPPGMPGNKSDQIYSAIIQERKIENLLEQINPERLITDIEFRLKGYKKNVFNKKWELIGEKEKEVCDEMVSDFLSILSANLTNNTTLSNFTPDEINKIMKTLIRTLIDMIRAKADVYGLKNDFAERNRILTITLSTVFYALKRAQGGSESRRVFDSIQIRDQPYQQQKDSLAKRLFGI
jgi:hypothetical protein